MSYEDFTVMYCYAVITAGREFKHCIIQEALGGEHLVVCFPDDDPIAVFIEANQ